MSRELWAVERCEHGFMPPDKVHAFGSGCRTGSMDPIDFDAIWRRFYETADRRFEEGLTYNELWYVIYGEKKEEE